MHRFPSVTSFRATLFGTLGLLPLAGCGAAERSTTFTCTRVEPANGGPDEGFELCAEGYYHRRAKLACAAPDRDAYACPGGTTDTSICATDADCVAGGPAPGKGAHCLTYAEGGACYCDGGCLRDDECSPGSVCDCQINATAEGRKQLMGRCVEPLSNVEVGCRVDADCGGGSFCASVQSDSCGSFGFACLTVDDECLTNDDCDGPSAGKYCGHDGKRRACLPITCQVGRPFRVEGADRLAPLTACGDWALAPEGLEPSGLAPALRAELGAYWANLGAMEHASVAAFARFALQLLALGAPPELVHGAQAAMADELEHARLCFGLATALGGRPVGPGPLSMQGALDAVSLDEVVRLAVIEGCVGETVAAIEAHEAYERASDPAVRRVLERVRGDETRHAELAWRFVRWALEVGGAEAREAASDAFARAIEGGGASGPGGAGEHEAPALAFGRLPERLSRELRQSVVHEVVAPCAERLLSAAARARAPLPSQALGAEASA